MEDIIIVGNHYHDIKSNDIDLQVGDWGYWLSNVLVHIDSDTYKLLGNILYPRYINLWVKNFFSWFQIVGLDSRVGKTAGWDKILWGYG